MKTNIKKLILISALLFSCSSVNSSTSASSESISINPSSLNSSVSSSESLPSSVPESPDISSSEDSSSEVSSTSSDEYQDPVKREDFETTPAFTVSDDADIVYEFDEENSKYIVTGFNPKAEDILIPDTYEGYPVEVNITSTLQSPMTKQLFLSEGIRYANISDQIWFTSLKYIYIPSSLDYLGIKITSPLLKSVYFPYGVKEAHVFISSSSLEKVHIPEGLKIAEYSSFSNCTSLKELNLPEGTESIHSNFAYNCRSLTSFTCPSTLKSIGYQAFRHCTSLKKVVFNEGLETLSEGRENAWHDFDSHMATIDTSGAFTECSALEEIELPSTLYSENGSPLCCAFSYCVSLKKVTIPDNIKPYILDNTFAWCTSLEEIDLPGCYQIKRGFYRCIALKNVTLHDNLKLITDEAFSNCISMEKISIPDSCQLKSKAFYNCTSLSDVSCNPENIYSTAFNSNAPFRSKHTSEGYFIVDDHLVSYCPNDADTLENVKIDGSKASTVNCNALGEFSKLNYVEFTEGIKVFKDGQLYYRSSLTDDSTMTYVIPESVETLSLTNLIIRYKSHTSEDGSLIGEAIIADLFYKGNKEDWNKVNFSDSLTSSDTVRDDYLYFYSETKPTNEGRYWHYDSDGIGVKWEDEA